MKHALVALFAVLLASTVSAEPISVQGTITFDAPECLTYKGMEWCRTGAQEPQEPGDTTEPTAEPVTLQDMLEAAEPGAVLALSGTYGTGRTTQAVTMQGPAEIVCDGSENGNNACLIAKEPLTLRDLTVRGAHGLDSNSGRCIRPGDPGVVIELYGVTLSDCDHGVQGTMQRLLVDGGQMVDMGRSSHPKPHLLHAIYVTGNTCEVDVRNGAVIEAGAKAGSAIATKCRSTVIRDSTVSATESAILDIRNADGRDNLISGVTLDKPAGASNGDLVDFGNNGASCTGGVLRLERITWPTGLRANDKPWRVENLCGDDPAKAVIVLDAEPPANVQVVGAYRVEP